MGGVDVFTDSGEAIENVGWDRYQKKLEQVSSSTNLNLRKWGEGEGEDGELGGMLLLGFGSLGNATSMATATNVKEMFRWCKKDLFFFSFLFFLVIFSYTPLFSPCF